MRQAGRYQPSYQALKGKYSFSELCLTPELACQVTLLPIQEMPLLDAAIIFSDILFPLESLGLKVLFDLNSSPRVMASPLYEDSLDGRVITTVTSGIKPLQEVCSAVYSAIHLVLKEIQGLPLIGFAGAPWTLLTYILSGKTSEDGGASLAFLRKEPALFMQLMNRVENLVIEHLSAQIEAGCDVVQLFDSWASPLTDEEFQVYITPSLQRITSALPVQKNGKKTPLIYFSKQIEKRLPLLNSSSIGAISCDHESSLSSVAAWAAGRGIAVQGNLDPFLLTRETTDPVLLEALSAMLSSMKNEPHYICNLGHGIPKNARYDTVRFVVEFIKHWS